RGRQQPRSYIFHCEWKNASLPLSLRPRAIARRSSSGFMPSSSNSASNSGTPTMLGKLVSVTGTLQSFVDAAGNRAKNGCLAVVYCQRCCRCEQSTFNTAAIDPAVGNERSHLEG